jgi:hypothetical protein
MNRVTPKKKTSISNPDSPKEKELSTGKRFGGSIDINVNWDIIDEADDEDDEIE